jgi:hypothetical protein
MTSSLAKGWGPCERPTPLLFAICSSRLSGSGPAEPGDVADGYLPGLHVIRHPPHKTDVQETVVERGVLDLDVFGQIETPFEWACRDSLIQILALTVFGLLAGDYQLTCLGRNPDLIRREPGQR